jgi:hypothetical protein
MFSRKIKFWIVAIALFIVAASLTFRQPPKYYLSVCAIFRNEARFLPEWIEYHRLHGVEHFYLLNNFSEDDYKTALKPYLDAGVVELYEWPYHGKNQKEWNKIQCGAYTQLLKEKKYETTWMAIIDTDEFLVPIETTDLKTFLKPYESYGGVAVNWQLFGTSNIPVIPSDRTLIGTLTHRAPADHPTNLFYKSIVQPRKVRKISEPHYCHYNRPFFHVTENFEHIPSKSVSPTLNINKIRLHHYTYRDELFFKSEKQKRFRQWHPDAPPLQIHPSYNEIEDTTLTAEAIKVEKNLIKY